MPKKDSYPKVALVTALLCVGFVVFVFVYDGLKTNAFVQGITGILVALAIAVILFSAVPGSIAKAVPVGLAGAAAFYFLILPKLEPYVFPLRTITFEGYVFYEKAQSSQEGAIPVEGAEVEIRNSGLRGKTDASGKFVIPNVPGHLEISDLMVSRGGKVYQIKVKATADRIYYIPRDPELVQSNKQTLSDEAWVENEGSRCPKEKIFGSPKQFSLRTNVPTLAGYSDLIFEVQSAKELTILKMRKSEPADGTRVETDDESKVQRWEFPVSSQEMTVAFSVCVGSLKRGVAIQKADLHTIYWFEKAQ